MKRAALALALALAASAAPAFAHTGASVHASFAAGLTHPMGGADHLLAMLAIGLYAAVLGGPARWTLPGGFVGGMMMGFLAALSGVALPFVEPMILASIIVLGGLLAVAFRPALPVSVALVALFGLFHGHAHGSELGAASALVFGAGFILGSSALHGAGVGLGVALTRSRMLRAILGTATAAAGVALAFA